MSANHPNDESSDIFAAIEADSRSVASFYVPSAEGVATFAGYDRNDETGAAVLNYFDARLSNMSNVKRHRRTDG